MSAIKRYIEAYAEQHVLTFEAAQVALAAQQSVRLSPEAADPTPAQLTTQQPVLTQGE